MRNRISLVVACLSVLLMSAFLLAGDKSWFDMQNCVFCKPWVESGLMKEMTHGHYDMSNGVLTVCAVPKAHMGDFRKINDQMHALSKRLMAGEKLTICQSCETMVGLMAHGAKMEEVDTDNGSVTLLTSSDAAVVTDIQKWAQRNRDEQKKMMMSSAPEK